MTTTTHTDDQEQEIHNLLKKSVNRLHAVKDDLRHVAGLVGPNADVELLAVVPSLQRAISDVNRVVAERRVSA